MSEHQEKKKRQNSKAASKQKPKAPEKPKRDFKTAMKELWNLEENRFLIICALGLLVIFLSTSLPGKAGLYVQSAIVGLIIFVCIVRNVRRSEPETKDEETAEKEEKTDEETT